MGCQRALLTLLIAAAITSSVVEAQGAAASPSGGDAASSKGPAFFDRVAPVRFTLSADIRVLLSDTADEAPSRDATVSVRDSTGKTVIIPVKVKTHGRWRLLNCEYPPLSITFPAAQTTGTPFEGLPGARLTSFCRDHPTYEQYILKELQLYRVYQLLTPYSHTARAVHVTYVDQPSGRTRATRYAFFIDDRPAVAARQSSALLKAKGAVGSDLEPYHRTLMGVFEYMIGNTDFLVLELHNVFLLGTPQGETIPVPYDFDLAGAVNSAYALPNPVLPIKNVRQRLFRGFCSDAEQFAKVFALLNAKKSAIYKLYDDEVGKLLRLDVANDTKAFLDEFYRIINTPELARAEIIDRCLKRE